MAKSMKKVVGCPSCGVLEEFIAYPSITIPTDREMRDKVLDETLFFWRCGSCDYETQMVYSCLYQDKIRKFMIYVQPKDEDPAVLKQISVSGLKEIKKRIVTNIEELKEKTLAEDFWSDSKKSGEILTKMKRLEGKKEKYSKLLKELQNLIEMNDLLLQQTDEELGKEVLIHTEQIAKQIEKLELETFFSGKYDKNNAILTIHPGAGGTESQDWAEMLYRMYTRWATANGFTVKELDYLEGEEAGLKSVTFLVEGENAYGYLKGEMGVHRLVRISPFDSGGRRHTSFASLEVLPEITEDIEIDINPDDLRIDTYRASRSRGTTY